MAPKKALTPTTRKWTVANNILYLDGDQAASWSDSDSSSSEGDLPEDVIVGRWSVRSLDDAWHEPDGFSAAYPFAFKNMTRRYFEKLNSLFHCQGSSQGATMQRHRGLPFQKVVCLHVFDSQP
jgi:hypothetical protein